MTPHTVELPHHSTKLSTNSRARAVSLRHDDPRFAHRGGDIASIAPARRPFRVGASPDGDSPPGDGVVVVRSVRCVHVDVGRRGVAPLAPRVRLQDPRGYRDPRGRARHRRRRDRAGTRRGHGATRDARGDHRDVAPPLHEQERFRRSQPAGLARRRHRAGHRGVLHVHLRRRQRAEDGGGGPGKLVPDPAHRHLARGVHHPAGHPPRIAGGDRRQGGPGGAVWRKRTPQAQRRRERRRGELPEPHRLHLRPGVLRDRGDAARAAALRSRSTAVSGAVSDPRRRGEGMARHDVPGRKRSDIQGEQGHDVRAGERGDGRHGGAAAVRVLTRVSTR
mmetsp:Transcript_6624/g.27522  ORF Transcript_6624/g.27522 Transcript_6624/m.27522 type:complete len:334 (-) Transcript_6624:1626-2627(-)